MSATGLQTVETLQGTSDKKFTREEVAKHNKEGDLWIIVDGAVWDMSKFADMHPGGAVVLLDAKFAGKDATEAFFGLHKAEVLLKYKRYKIGMIEGENAQISLPTPGALSKVPMAEPQWLSKGYYSPYYNDGHRAFQKEIRKFIDEHVTPEAHAHEKSGKRPTVELIQLMGSDKWLINHMRMGPGKHLHGLTLPGGIKGEDFDYFHELIITQEIARSGARGFCDGMQGGMVIGLPPVMNFGSPELKKKVVPAVLKGEKFISLAISEAFAGSDVAGLQCVATKTPDGKFYIVNGTKKWITNGTFSDYFSVGVRTGEKDLTMLLIERDDTVETKLIKTSYSTAAGTAYITFTNTKVPVENRLGKEGKGLMVILSNFNHERWVMCNGATRSGRFITEECFKWANQRKVFGKPLIAQPVIRQRFARMFSMVESGQAWLEAVTYQMTKMNYFEQADLLAGQIAGLKATLTRHNHEISDHALAIFGGRGLTQSGMGGIIEGFRRGHEFDSVLGGAEDVLYDLFAKQTLRKMKKAAL